MGRADELRAGHEAELAVAELEEELVRLKGLKRPDAGKLRDTKLALRDARQRFRAIREGAPAEVAPGDAVATPATVETSAGPADLGGEG